MTDHGTVIDTGTAKVLAKAYYFAQTQRDHFAKIALGANDAAQTKVDEEEAFMRYAYRKLRDAGRLDLLDPELNLNGVDNSD